jgi:membrane complex biogenesis BtpA family protein
MSHSPAFALPPNALIGMVHLRALPGSPGAHLSLDEIVRTAATEARALAEAGFDALIVENMHDRPYVHGRHGPETTAAMTRAALAVRDAAPKLPLGVQVLSGGNEEALAIALAAGGSFIRCENFVFSHVADEGLLAEAEAGPLLRYRRKIGAEHVAIYADLKKKHASHAITADISIAEAAEAAAFFGADGVIVTGSATGKPVAVRDLESVAGATDLPVLVGSGVTPESAATLLKHADALIVGSSVKQGGLWSSPLDPSRCRTVVEAVRRARS